MAQQTRSDGPFAARGAGGSLRARAPRVYGAARTVLATATTTVLAIFILSGSAAWPGAYFAQTLTTPVPGPGKNLSLDSTGTGGAVIRMASAWCQFPLGGPREATGVLVQIALPAGPTAHDFVTIPMTEQVADDRAPSPSRYFGGTLQTYFELGPGVTAHLSVVADSGYEAPPGVCYVSVFGDFLPGQRDRPPKQTQRPAPGPPSTANTQ